ncbi:SDR family NAD(P)-dependent oxidoreductase [Chloroflexota bacterium]
MNLEGRIAVVTGGSRGIGRGIALALAKAGADVAFCYRQDEAAAKSTAAQVETLWGRCLSFQADITDYGKVKEMVNKTVETFGGVDILVNSAGIAGGGRYLADMDIEHMHRVINTHVFGSFHFVKAVLPHIRKRKRGDIYFISSVSTQNFRAGSGAYTMAKASLEAMAKCLAKEELANNIRVNAIGPGTIESDMTLKGWQRWYDIKEVKDLYPIMPFGCTGQPEDIGNLIAFLASEAGGWISGQVIYVDGSARGYSISRLLSSG